MRTVEAFHAFCTDMDIVVVLPASQQDYWRGLCEAYGFAIPHRIADGGETRFLSVKSGLSLIDGDEGLVGVHDGVRPFVAPEVISACYEAATMYGAAIPVTDVVETLRLVSDGGSMTVPRDSYKLVQTPQVFSVGLLKRAYSQDYRPCFTDDASVVEALGVKVHLVKGNRENIKLTSPFDLLVAEALADK